MMRKLRRPAPAESPAAATVPDLFAASTYVHSEAEITDTEC